MKSKLYSLSIIFLLLWSTNCNRLAGLQDQQEMHFIGSTPGDSLIKSIMNIPTVTPVDFIRWDLVLNQDAQSYSLNIHYGVSKPNTTGFKEGDEHRSYTGDFKIGTFNTENNRTKVYRLLSKDFTTGNLSLVSLGNKLLHILTPDNSLMVGNGGWSYTLNMESDPGKKSEPFQTLIPAGELINDTILQIVFDGRTPCQEFSEAFKLSTFPGCFKLKWRLTLNRDPVSRKPSTYKLIRTDIRNIGSVEGKWIIISTSDPNVVIYKLDPDQPDKSISILAGDENVLFFLDKDNRLFTGNEDHSYTLNRKNPV